MLKNKFSTVIIVCIVIIVFLIILSNGNSKVIKVDRSDLIEINEQDITVKDTTNKNVTDSSINNDLIIS